MTFLDFVVKILLPVVGVLAGGGGLAALWQARAVLQKASSESAKIAAEAKRIEAETSSLLKKSDIDRYEKLAQALQEDNVRLRTNLAESDERIDRLRDLLDMTTEQHRKQLCELEQRYKQQVVEMDERHREEMKAREAQMQAMEDRHRREISALRAGVVLLIGQLREMGCQPAWEPEWAAVDGA